MEAGSVVRAIFDFCPSVSEELPLFVGDVIEVLAVVDEFWLLGKKEDVTGQFPSSFVEVVTVPSLKEGESLFVCTCEFTSREMNSLSLHRGDLVVLDGSPNAGWLQGRSCWGARGFFPSSCVREFCLTSQSQQWHSQSALLQTPEYSMGQARALMGLSAQLDEELDFREGDMITIIGVPEPGWFEGELDGRRGIFPEGFVELLGPLRTVDKSVNSRSGDDCIANGEVDISTEETESGADEDEHPTGTYGLALYRFQALEPNELDFDVGDKIQILGTLEDGWLEGRLKGRTGIFPHRFVKLCPSSRTEEAVLLPQGDSLPEKAESSVDGLENSVVEEATLGPQECGAEKPDWGLPEETPVPLDHDVPECVLSENSGQGEDDSGTSPGVGLVKDPSTGDPSEVVHCISSQPWVPFHPQVQKGQFSSTPGESHQSLDPFLDFVPREARTRDYSSLPPKTTYAQCRSLQKPAHPLHRASSLTTSRIAKPSYFRPPAVASCGQKHQTSAENASSLYSAPERSERQPGPPDKGPATEVTMTPQGDSIDLDSKLTQQLIEFEKSLSGPGTEPDKIVRHFSIMDFNSEKDIVRGSSKSVPSQELPERRKALRPPPPRPCTPTSIAPHLVDQSPKPAPPLAVRPSRPAPLPPSTQQRMNTASSKFTSCTLPSWEAPEKECPEPADQSPAQTSQSLCPSVLVRIQDVENDLDMYTRAQEELTLMLEERQDDSLRAEMLENLKFYESSIQSLTLELQQLRGKSQETVSPWFPHRGSVKSTLVNTERSTSRLLVPHSVTQLDRSVVLYL